MISIYAGSLCSYLREKSWETEQSCHLSATLKCRKHFPEHYLQLPGRRWGQSPARGANWQSQEFAFSYQLLALVCKQIKTESFRKRGDQTGRVTSGFWEKLTQDKCWIIGVTDEGDTRNILLALRYCGQRDMKLFCLYALIPKPAPSS